MAGEQGNTADIDAALESLNQMNRDDFVSISRFAALCHRDKKSIERAIERQELPPPHKLMKSHFWTVGALIDYIEGQITQATEETRQASRKVTKLAGVR